MTSQYHIFTIQHYLKWFFTETIYYTGRVGHMADLIAYIKQIFSIIIVQNLFKVKFTQWINMYFFQFESSRAGH